MNHHDPYEAMLSDLAHENRGRDESVVTFLIGLPATLFAVSGWLFAIAFSMPVR